MQRPLLDQGKGFMKDPNSMEKAYTVIPPTAAPRPRLVDRSGSFRQSFGSYNIRRIGGNWRSLYIDAPFHTVLNTKTSRIVSGVFFAYALVIFIFAILYRMVHTSCNLGVQTLMQAWMFSLETIMTIGYGAPQNDIFYSDCASMAILLTLESFAGIFLDSICIGIFFARFSRAQSRASTIIFSEYAVIRKIGKHFYFMFQVCERRKHQLVEAHVRCYAIRHENIVPLCNSTTNDSTNKNPDEDEVLFQSHLMRLQQPDDDLGSFLLMALPQIVVHRIDPWSPLYPIALKNETNEEYDASRAAAFPYPLQREVDVENGNREAKVNSNPPREPPTEKEIKHHIDASELEVVAVLEGIDGPTSATMQARHSYNLDDIQFNCTFARCVSRNEVGGALIDFDKFHSLVPTSSSSNIVIPQSVL